jgi:uncharacterized protein
VKIKLSDIPDEGLEIEGTEALGSPYADPDWTLEDLHLRLERDGDTVFVQGSLGASVPLSCGRCLEPMRVRLSPEVSSRLVPAPRGRVEGRELGSDDLETDVYAGDTIDLGALVETETSLALPMKPLCRADCRGLCPVCGINRNSSTCACETSTPDPRWAALKGLADRLSSH